MLNAIKALPNWVVTDKTKIPRVAGRNSPPASVSAPESWRPYQEAIDVTKEKIYPYLGFVLTKESNTVIIDIDVKENSELSIKQKQILKRFASKTYIERSMSGRGYHIICFGNVSRNFRAKGIEVYGSARFIAITESAETKNDIANCQEELDWLCKIMLEPVPDESILYKIENSSYADKFVDLGNGNWQGHFDSQSEADLSFVRILSYFTQDEEQINRLFKLSELGRRPKATRPDYWAGLMKQIDLVPMINKSQPIVKIEQPKIEDDIILESHCPSILKELSQYLLGAAPRPVQIISSLAALTALLGISSNKVLTPTGAGINQYSLLIAPTGRGKDWLRAGVGLIYNQIEADSILGPSSFASGVALVKSLQQQPTMLTIAGEYGVILNRVLDKKAAGYELDYVKTLLEIYSLSGAGGKFHGHVYADEEKNTGEFDRPCFSLIGETTESLLFPHLTIDTVASGFLPRFLFFFYQGDRPLLQTGGLTPMELKLVDYLKKITFIDGSCYAQFSLQAKEASRSYDEMTTKQINQSADGVAELWNRAHLKCLKLATLAAFIENPESPVISLNNWLWGENIVQKSTERLLENFTSGRVGGGENVQLGIILELIKKLSNDGEIKKSLIFQRVANLKVFKDDPQGVTRALDRALINAIEAEILIKDKEKRALTYKIDFEKLTNYYEKK